ncbi:MAG: peptidylprolyl isomerase [Candidatus Zixiibacteriota bacterium]
MKRISILLLVFLFFLFGCGKKEEVQTEKIEEKAEEAVPEETAEKKIMQEPIIREKNPIVVMETNFGPIEIELYWKESPKLAENFLRLVLSGFYDGLTFHRIVPGFVIQGGDPKGDGTGGPGYTLPDEPTVKKHERGAIAMARGPQGNSGSQFYICLSTERTAHLDQQNFTVFAHVTGGMDVVDKIAQVPTDPRGMPQEKVTLTKVYEKTE